MSGDLRARAESRERLRLEPTTPPVAVRQGVNWRLLGIMLLLTALAGLIGAALYAYSAGVRTSGEVTAPLIKAEPGEIKRKPEEPGGMEPAHQDKLIFDRVAPVDAPPVEHLRPGPEEPLQSATAPEPEGEPPTWVSEDEAPPAAVATPSPPATGAPEAPPPQVAAAPETERGQAPEGAGPAGATDAQEPPARTESLMPRQPEAEPGPAPDASAPAAGAAKEPADPSAEPRSASEAPAETAATPDAPASTSTSTSAANESGTPPAEPAPAPTAEKPAEPAPTQEAARPGYRVQLAALRTEALADRAWRELVKAHNELLGDLQHFIERADLGKERGVFYRVQVGPFPGKPEANALCAALRRQSASCLVVGGR